MSDLRKQTEIFLKESEWEKARLARSMGYKTSSLLSRWLNDKSGTSGASGFATLEKNLKDFFSSYKTQTKTKTKIIETYDYLMAQYVIDKTISKCEIAILVGKPGTGKSTVLQECTRNTPNALVIECTSTMRTKGLLVLLATMLKLGTRGTSETLLRDISGALTERNMVLFVDECEELDYTSVNTIRRIHEFSDTPVILVGTEKLDKILTGPKGDFDRIKSRIMMRYEFRGLKAHGDRDDMGALCAVNGMTKVRPLIEALSGGIFRKAQKLINNVKEAKADTGQPISETLVRDVASLMYF